MTSTSSVVDLLSTTSTSLPFTDEYYGDYNDFNYSVAESYQLTNRSICRGHLVVTDWMLTKMLLGMLYTAVFIVAVSGNSLVVYVVMSNRNMQTVTNLFITNLAISDLLVNFTSLWLTPIYTYIGHWVWGGWLCYGLPLFQGTSIFISTLTLTAIAIDRYIVIVHPMKRRISVHLCIAVITFIWTLSLLLVMPYAVQMRMTFIPRPCSFFLCIEHWGNDNLRSTYGMIVMSLQFIVPFVIIGFCYIRIWIKVERVNETTLTRMGSQYRSTVDTGDETMLDSPRTTHPPDTRYVAATHGHERSRVYTDNTNGHFTAINGREQVQPLLSSADSSTDTNF
uniref:G-protein coupled receptors family 1 profile domain-containing protein n=1 Tax=Plectus sambesii TaxID=2011161 RepID=A0A914VXC8_9BILA